MDFIRKPADPPERLWPAVYRRWACLLAVWLATMPAGAGQMFLKLAGVDGESQDKLHPKEIEVLAWSWGMTQGRSSTGAGVPNIQEITVMKWLDKSSPALLRAVCDGHQFTNAVLTIRKSADTADYYRIELTGVQARALQSAGSSGEDRFAESVWLRFQTFKMDYVQVAADGTSGARNGLFWDIPGNTGNTFSGEPVRTAPFVATLSFAAGAPQATISWPSVPGKQYRVSFAEGLDQPFVPLAVYPAGGAQQMSVAVPLAKAKGFFRVDESSE